MTAWTSADENSSAGAGMGVEGAARTGRHGKTPGKRLLFYQTRLTRHLPRFPPKFWISKSASGKARPVDVISVPRRSGGDATGAAIQRRLLAAISTLTGPPSVIMGNAARRRRCRPACRPRILFNCLVPRPSQVFKWLARIDASLAPMKAVRPTSVDAVAQPLNCSNSESSSRLIFTMSLRRIGSQQRRRSGRSDCSPRPRPLKFLRRRWSGLSDSRPRRSLKPLRSMKRRDC